MCIKKVNSNLYPLLKIDIVSRTSTVRLYLNTVFFHEKGAEMHSNIIGTCITCIPFKIQEIGLSMYYSGSQFEVNVVNISLLLLI